MRGLSIARPGERVRVLCLGAHSDDIEIGMGGLLLSLIGRGVALDVYWFVLSGRDTPRADEANSSAAEFLAGAASMQVDVLDFRDGFFPQDGERIKSWFESLKPKLDPDYIFTHNRYDAHQDHRETCRLTWNTFRDHCIFEYEIPKWDGDLGQPNVYYPLTGALMTRKVQLLDRHFGSQRSKHWFDSETFTGLARLRGLECRAEERYAEAFYARKLALS